MGLGNGLVEIGHCKLAQNWGNHSMPKEKTPEQIKQAALRATGKMFEAILADDAESLEKCLRGGANPNARKSNGATLLIEAAKWGAPLCAKALLDAGADLNAGDRGGWTAERICGYKTSSGREKSVLAVILEQKAKREAQAIAVAVEDASAKAGQAPRI